MDQATYDIIAAIAGAQADKLEYWHDSQKPAEARWGTTKPEPDMVHVPGVVHEASTLMLSDDHFDVKNQGQKASVDKEYRAAGLGNVFVTGGAIFPTAGSWNREP
jgi:hypothetical protein